MSYRRILVALDGSRHAEAVLATALEQARLNEAELLLATAVYVALEAGAKRLRGRNQRLFRRQHVAGREPVCVQTTARPGNEDTCLAQPLDARGNPFFAIHVIPPRTLLC